jgi:predicted ArsR family transcriptional regulator
VNQPTLWDARTKARTTDPATSHAAARAAAGTAADHHRTILDVMRCGTDWTADEIALHCHLDRHQIGRRLGELERAGKVRKSGATRPTATGRQANCYEVVR